MNCLTRKEPRFSMNLDLKKMETYKDIFYEYIWRCILAVTKDYISFGYIVLHTKLIMFVSQTINSSKPN